MVDPDILIQKTMRVLHHCARLESRQTLSAAELLADEDLANTILMDLQQAIQGCIDLATHACVFESLGKPTTASDAFSLLEKHGRLSAELSRQLSGAAGLRNLIVHQYDDIDFERIVHVVQNDLKDLREFLTTFNR